MSEPEIQKADPAARRKALVVLLIGAVVGVVLSLFLEGWLREYGELILAEPIVLCSFLGMPVMLGGVLGLASR